MKKLLFLFLLIPTWGFAQTYDDATLLLHDSTQIKQLGWSPIHSWQMFKEVIQNKVSSNAFKISAGGDITWGTGFAGAARTLTADGSATDVSVNINPKGAGGVSLINSLFQFGSVAGSATLLVNGTGAFTIFGPDGATSNGKDIYLKAGDGGTLSGTFNGGSTYLSGGLGSGGGVTGNVGFGTSVGSFGGGSKVVFVANAAVNPSTNPTGGFILYGDAGNASHPTIKLPSGTTIDLSLGGITNTAANNEIPKSNATNIIPSGIFSSTLGDLTFGTGLSGTTRTITADGSGADVSLSYAAKGQGGHSFSSGSSGGVGFSYGSSYSISLVGAATSIFRTSKLSGAGSFFISASNGVSGGTAGDDLTLNAGSGYSSGVTNGGNVYISPGAKNSTGLNGNIGLFTSSSGTFGAGEKVLFWADATTNPTTNPTSGGIMFVKSSDHSPYWRTPAGVESSMLGSGGTVSTVSVVSANGLAGTVANPTTTPAITLSTTITGLVKGNGTAFSAASAGTDYQAPITFGTGVQTALGVNVGSAGAPILFNGAGGTPTSLILTNATGLSLTAGVTGILPVANGGTNASSASITAFNNITGYTASGATGTTSTNLVFSTSPTLTNPVVGTQSAADNSTKAASTAYVDALTVLTSGNIVVGNGSNVATGVVASGVVTVNNAGVFSFVAPITNSIVGVTTNSNATAGNLGEEVPAIQSTYTNYTTTATYQNVTSINLTAGDWDISAEGTLSTNSATLTTSANTMFVISTTTASAAGSVEAQSIVYIDQNLLGTSKQSISISPYRVSLSVSATYYLNTQSTFTLGNPQFVGSIRARRMR